MTDDSTQPGPAPSQPGLTPSASPYDLFGGTDFFTALVADFYAGVAGDEVLRPMYPEEDLGPAEERLRMRHAPYQVDEAARDHWLAHMRAALDARNLSPEADDAMWRYLLTAAQAMVNTSLVTGPDQP